MTPAEESSREAAQSDAEQRLDPGQLDELWDFDDATASELRFRGLLGSGNLSPTARAELQTQLARALGMLGRHDEALAALDAVTAASGAAEQATAEPTRAAAATTEPADRGAGDHPDLTQPAAALSPVVGVRIALERGRILNSSGKPTDSIALFATALEAARAAGEDFLAIDAAHMLAIADRARSEHWTNEALRMVASSTEPRTRRWAGSLHNNAGWARHDAGDYTAALAEFEAARSAYEVHGTFEQVRVAQWAVARALRSLARFDEALAIQQQLAELGPADGYVQEELAELFLAKGSADDAGRHAAEAVELLGADTWFTQYESGRWERLRRIAQLS